MSIGSVYSGLGSPSISWPEMQQAGWMGAKSPFNFGAGAKSGGGMALGPWMALSAGMSLIGGMQQGRAMQRAAATTAASNERMANVAAGAQRDVGKGNLAQGMAARSAQFGWGADLDEERQLWATKWDKTRGRDLDRAANYDDSKAKSALLTDRNLRAAKEREHKRKMQLETARSQAAMAGMFGPIRPTAFT